MDTLNVFDSMMRQRREKMMETSPQLTLIGLIKLIMQLSAIDNKDLPVVFDDGQFRPINLDCWRGSYGELAIGYERTGGNIVGLNLAQFYEMLNDAIGQTYEGYKGGDFVMGKDTPVWVANYGNCQGFTTDDDHNPQAVVGVTGNIDKVVIITQAMEY